MTSLASLLACPACLGELADDTRLTCVSCGAAYPMVDGVPVLLRAPLTGEAAKQAAHFDADVDHEYETERPLGTPAWHGGLLAEKFARGVAGLADLMPGATALVTCGGSGMDAEFLARAGARVITSDVSLRTAQRARERALRHGFELLSVVADATALPLRDRSVDLGYVHDGLHHVERPLDAVAELARVARLAVSVNEPARAAATAAAVKIGLALEREEAGNRVRRLTTAEVAAELRAAGFGIVVEERYAMLYRHEPGPVSRLLSRRRLLPLARRAASVAGRLTGRLGNKLTVQARRDR